MCGEEGGEAREVTVEPGFKRKSSGKRRRRRNRKVLKERDESRPVGQGPIGRGGRGRGKWV